MKKVLKNILIQFSKRFSLKNTADMSIASDDLRKPSLYAAAAQALMLMSVLILVACQSENAVPPEGQQQLQAIVIAHDEPNRYHVNLRWPENNDAMGWLIARASRKDSGPVPIVTLEKGQQQFVDDKVVAGEEYRYQMIAVESSRYRVVSEASVAIPRDVEIKGESTLHELTQINRLFLRANSKLVTNGEDLVIGVNEIISEGSVIETFPLFQVAADGTDGRNGGSIWIAAQSGRGVLDIYSRGEHGGRVLRNTPTTSGDKGTASSENRPGHGGNSARVFVQIQDASHFQLKPHAYIGQGGSGISPYTSGGDGFLQPTCIRLSGASLGDCESFNVQSR